MELDATALPAGAPADRIATVAARIAAAGRAAWPGVVVTEAAIGERIAAVLRDDPGATLVAAHDADVYLAMALAAGDRAALAAFEATLVPQIAIALRRLRLPDGTLDEVTQALRSELLVGDGSPKIADYTGRGELAAWLRVSATRKAIKLARKAGQDETLDDVLLENWPNATPGPEKKHLRATYTAELKAAIRDAFATLTVRQRNLLRQHILDELTIDDLARLYRVHRATCARWLADARSDLARTTRKRLTSALGMPSAEVESLLRFLDSDIELSISRIMKSR